MSVRLFLSHHEFDARYCDKLAVHLRVAERHGRVTLWHRRQVSPGLETQRIIDAHLEEADIVVVLISPDLMASDYCWGVEVSAALERHRCRRARLVPLILRHCSWVECFDGIMPVPVDGKPIVASINQMPEDEPFEGAARAILALASEIERNANQREPTTVTPISEIAAMTRALAARRTASDAATSLYRLNLKLRYDVSETSSSEVTKTKQISPIVLRHLLDACKRASLETGNVVPAQFAGLQRGNLRRLESIFDDHEFVSESSTRDASPAPSYRGKARRFGAILVVLAIVVSSVAAAWTPIRNSLLSYYLARECELGAKEHCGLLGQLYVTAESEGGLGDDYRAIEFLRRGCSSGDWVSCETLGQMFEAGRGGLPRDELKALAVYQGACDHDRTKCAVRAALALGNRDQAHGLLLFRAACPPSANDEICIELRRKAEQ